MTLCNSVNVSKEKGSSHVSVTGDVYADNFRRRSSHPKTNGNLSRRLGS